MALSSADAARMAFFSADAARMAFVRADAALHLSSACQRFTCFLSNFSVPSNSNCFIKTEGAYLTGAATVAFRSFGRHSPTFPKPATALSVYVQSFRIWQEQMYNVFMYN
jgi:hypothetical protein